MDYFARPVSVIRDFTLVMLACGGIAAWMKLTAPAGSPTADLALLVWLVGPMLAALLYMLAGGWVRDAGLGFRLPASARYYLLAIAVPVGIAAILLVPTLLLAGGFGSPDAAALAGLTALVVTTLIKNVFEEVYWRGVLTTQFARTGLSRLTGHLLTGAIWTLWHLPYWFVLLSPEEIAAATGLSVPVLFGFGAISLLLQSVLYGELRLRSGSIWPGYLLHTLSNLIGYGLPAVGMIRAAGIVGPVLTPETHGLFYSLAFLVLGLMLLRRNRART